MAVFTVTTLLDVVDATDGFMSLREAVAQAELSGGPDVIDFDTGLAGTITLASELGIYSDISIIGNGPDITISGGGTTRIFQAFAGSNLTLRSLNLTGGNSGNGNGGALFVDSAATATIVYSTISGNESNDSGGAIGVEGMLTIVNSTLSGNIADRGGAISVSGGYATATLVNTTISGNDAATGGGIHVNAGTLRLQSATITDNDAGGFGDGLVLNTLASLFSENSVVAGNGVIQADISDFGATFSATNSFFGSTVTIDTDGGGNINGGGDPKLGALADNGGPVLTHAPLAGSPLIGAGKASALPADTFNLDGDGSTTEKLSLDATGAPRVLGALDIGAVESRLDLVVTTLSDSVDMADGQLSLREAVILANSTSGAKITFAAGLSGTINLTIGQLALTSDVTINGDTNGDRKADITISGNNASRIFNISGAFTDVDLASLTLTGGNASGDAGGAILVTAARGRLTVIDSTIQNSTASLDGGGIHSEAEDLVIVNSLITGNSSNFGGGILLAGSSKLFLTNSTIHANTATTDGGGIDTSGGNTVIIHSSTITGNTAGGTGGGLDLFQGSTATVVNSVFTGNTAASGADIGESGADSQLNASSNLFAAAPAIDSGSGNIVNANPLLGALADNGGPVKTRTPLNGSPLVSAGNAGLLPFDTQDIDGDGNTTEALPLDGTRSARVIGTLDIGAVEFAPPTIGNGATATVAENSTAVTTVFATDPANQLIDYSIVGGADAARFVINPGSGALSFLAAPDFEAPLDAGGNNIYDVIVRARDASGLFDDRALAVTVTDVAESDRHDLGGTVGGLVSGSAAGLFGDTVLNFGTDDTIRFTDTVTKLSDLIISGNQVRLASAGPNSAPLTLGGDFSDGRFFVVKNAAGGADLFFQKNLADVALVEGRALSDAEVNGAPHPAALTGDGARQFVVTLSDKATAGNDNALGVYEIDAAGNIVDVRILFGNVKADPNATATIGGVEAGHKLGFFIVAGGVDAGAASFVDAAGGSAQLADGAGLRLQIDGRAVDATVFHAYSSSLNPDGLVHARSGADPSDHGVRVAFEDLLSGGDRDFQDVVFRVDVVDQNGDFLI